MQKEENLNRVMEPKTISKNGVSWKKLIMLFIAVCLSAGVYGQTASSKAPASTKGWKKDAKNLLAEAEQGSADAQDELGGYFYSDHKNKNGIPNDDEQAVYWFRKAAEQGHDDAYKALAYSYRKGRGVRKDLDSAIYWYERLLNNSNVIEEKKFAREWIAEIKAEQGDATALFRLGDDYNWGWHGMPEDKEQGVYWYRKAAEQEESQAQLSMGRAYRYGNGVKEDLNTAIYWNERVLKNDKAYDGLKELARESIEEIKNEISSAREQRLSQPTTSSSQSTADADREHREAAQRAEQQRQAQIQQGLQQVQNSLNDMANILDKNKQQQTTTTGSGYRPQTTTTSSSTTAKPTTTTQSSTPQPQKCSHCSGTGKTQSKCTSSGCFGSGKVQVSCSNCSGKGYITAVGGLKSNCITCKGTGKITKDCNYCKGKGYIEWTCSYCNGTGKR